MIELLKKHVDTVVILGGMLAATCWMNNKINGVNDKIAGLDNRLVVIEATHVAEKLDDMSRRLTVIETVMLCKNIMPSHVAMNDGSK